MRYIFAAIFYIVGTLAVLADSAPSESETASAVAPVAATSLTTEADTLRPQCDAAALMVADPTTRFRPQQLIFPAAAIALGGAGVRSHLIDTSSPRAKHQFEDNLQYVPIVAYAGLGFIPGVSHSHRFGDRLMAGASAYIVMTAVCQGAKHLIREPRPDTGGRNSFPSGHTATAFCGAELTRIEYGNAYGAAAYAFAVTTGVMRVVNNRHWCNDVLAGAGVGFLSAHIGYWLLPWEKRVVRSVFHRRGAEHAASSPFILAPTYEYDEKAPGLTFAMTF